MELFEPNIKKMEGKQDVEGLVKALGYPKNNDVRKNAAGALERILFVPSQRYDTLIDALSKYLNDPEWDIRRACIKTLGKIGSEQAVDVLLSLIDREDSREAIFALTKIHNPRTIEPLLGKLEKDENRDLVLPALLEFGDMSVEPLCKLLTKSDCPSSVRCEIARAFGERGDILAISALMELIVKENEIDIRNESIRTLGKIGDERAIPVLISPMVDGNLEAAHALKLLGWRPQKDETGVHYYLLMKDVGPCAEIGEPAVPQLLSALKSSNDGIRNTAGMILEKIGEPTIPYLLAALQDDDFSYRQRVVNILVQLKWKPGMDIANGAWYWIAREMWEKLEKKCIEAGADVLPALLGTLNVNNFMVRIQAAKVLGKLGDQRAVNPLISAMSNEYYRPAASQALEQIGWEPGTDEAGARYQIARGNYEACLEIGAMSIGPLVAELQGKERVKAARVLVQLYQSGKLDETAKKLILEQRRLITQPHEDNHKDEEGWSDPHCDKDLWTSHTDDHTDLGGGMDFPF
jgi:HEAT repeat protein